MGSFQGTVPTTLSLSLRTTLPEFVLYCLGPGCVTGPPATGQSSPRAETKLSLVQSLEETLVRLICQGRKVLRAMLAQGAFQVTGPHQHSLTQPIRDRSRETLRVISFLPWAQPGPGLLPIYNQL